MGWRPVYATEGDLKLAAGVSDDIDDDDISDALEAAARIIDWDTGRQFGAVAAAESREYGVAWDPTTGLWRAEIDDLMTTTNLDVVVDGSSLAASQYRLEPRNSPQEGRPWEWIMLDEATEDTLGSGPRTVDIIAIWGWVDSGDAQATPTGIKRANVQLGLRLWQRAESPLGVLGSPELGTDISLQDIDVDVARMVRPFWRLGKAQGFAG